MKELKISAVSYLNTFPFVYGILQSGFLKNYQLELDIPRVCARKLKDRKVDISLVPVGALPDFDDYHFVSNDCIGAVGPVKTVLLLSKSPLERIGQVHLDYDSRTSVQLVKILAKHYWGISPGWKNMVEGQALAKPSVESLVAIGDKTFELRKQFPFCYDLAEEWIRFTGLPFVFAVWISNDPLPPELTTPFCQALSWGLDRKAGSLEFFRDKLPGDEDYLEYLEKNISFGFDERKKEGLSKFLNYFFTG